MRMGPFIFYVDFEAFAFPVCYVRWLGSLTHYPSLFCLCWFGGMFFPFCCVRWFFEALLYYLALFCWCWFGSFFPLCCVRWFWGLHFSCLLCRLIETSYTLSIRFLLMLIWRHVLSFLLSTLISRPCCTIQPLCWFEGFFPLCRLRWFWGFTTPFLYFPTNWIWNIEIIDLVASNVCYCVCDKSNPQRP